MRNRAAQSRATANLQGIYFLLAKEERARERNL